MEGCGETLIRSQTSEVEDVLGRSGIVLGEEAHIRSKKPGGPRHESNYPLENFDTYQNLILMCRAHHKVIDDQNGRWYSINDLEAMKKSHEKRMAAAGAVDRELLLVMASQLETWTLLIGLDEWEREISSILTYSTPHLMSDSLVDRIGKLSDWLLRAEWPSEYPRTRAAFGILRDGVGCLHSLISQYMTRSGARSGFHALPLGYKNIPWDETLYLAKLRDYHTQRVQLQWIVYYVTGAMNLVVGSVREEFDRFYRYASGYQIIVLDYGLDRITFKPEIPPSSERDPYVALDKIRREYEAGDPRVVDFELIDLIDDPA